MVYSDSPLKKLWVPYQRQFIAKTNSSPIKEMGL
jgi:hypothetical protein